MRAMMEYKRFLQKNLNNLSDYEKKISRLILENFSEVANTVSAKGQRGKYISDLVNKNRDVQPDLGEIDSTSQDQSATFSRLTKISIGNFRGFSDEHSLEFKTPYTFVYGPNGTGKSSLCEALEYCLIGSISEADAKRIPTQEYIKNAYSNKSSDPILIGIDQSGKEAKVTPNQQAYEFCFVEKNRIDGFARVSANTPQAQQSRLAALFGLEEFNSFVSQFNESITTYMDCEGKLSKQLLEKEKLIASHKLFVSTAIERNEKFCLRQKLIVEKYPDLKTLEDVSIYINGNDQKNGLISQLNEKIAKLGVQKEKANPGINELTLIATDLSELLKERTELIKAVATYKDQLTLRDLYSAIQKHQDTSPNNCPACHSEIYRNENLVVPRNPYLVANDELKKFDVAIKQEGRLGIVREQLKEKWNLLKNKLILLRELAIALEADVGEWNQLNEQATSAKQVEEIEIATFNIKANTSITEKLQSQLNAYNKSVADSAVLIAKLQMETKAATELNNAIFLLKNQILEDEKALASAKLEIEKFNTENEKLIAEVTKERQIVESNKLFALGYLHLKEKLEKYNTALPATLSENLNAKALEFYNAINQHDHPDDQLATLQLPTSSGKKLSIGFKNGQSSDALQVLSEGHIRCLGLSILLAKNVNENLPFLIFDDVVNSIDDEHRQGVIDVILGNQDINKGQLIITTHGEDFVKRLESAIKKSEYSNMVTRIDFLVPEESKKILIKLDSPKHYLIVADNRFSDGSLRDSLSYGRKAFEELLNRLWRYLNNRNYSVQIEVAVRGPNGTPDLMAIATGLRKFISKATVTEKKEILPLLDEMIGNDKKYPLEWTYLNKGTHEESRKEEFDRTSVKSILSLLAQMDAII